MKKRIEAPFPQADNLETIYNIFFEIGPEGLIKEDVVGKYGLSTERQGDYYLNALLFIGIVEKYGVRFFLNGKGVKLRLESSSQLRAAFCAAILENDFLRQLYTSTLHLDKIEKRLHISNQIVEEFDLAISTAQRRAKTICSWLEWIETNMGESE